LPVTAPGGTTTKPGAAQRLLEKLSVRSPCPPCPHWPPHPPRPPTRRAACKPRCCRSSDIAPEIDPSAIDTGALLREQVDLDSADWLDFLTAIEQRLGVAIADTEAAHLRTLDQIVTLCARALSSHRP